MVTVRYTETYDLSTQIDKMGLIGIHTPTLRQLKALYPGLITNYKFLHVDSCDVVCACASVLPADPLQVGTEAGDIAPQDLFNPILYTAVSNDSFNTVVNRIYGLDTVNGTFGYSDDAFPDSSADDFAVYYTVLASQDRWKKAMPQQGFSMDGLYPIVYHMLTTNANTVGSTSLAGRQIGTDSTGNGNTFSDDSQYFRGNACRMPRIPLHTQMPGAITPSMSAKVGNSLVTFNPGACDPIDDVPGQSVHIPTTYVCAILTPPAKLHKLFYRMRVTWTFTFEEVIPITEYARITDIANRASYFYQSDYANQSKVMDKTDSTVDVKNLDLERVMTAGK